MGFFSSGPTLRQVDDYSIMRIDEELGQSIHLRRVDRGVLESLLDEFHAYSTQHNLGMIKKSKIVGNLEFFLSQAVSSPERHEFMKLIHARLLKKY